MTRRTDADARGRFATRAIHAGQAPDQMSGAIMPPIYQTSTYVHDAFGQHKGYEYARGKNPTREALERNVASLEGGQHGFAFSSGMGCLDSIMKLFKSGDHIVCGENVYGGTFRLFDKILQHFGLQFTFVDTRDPQRIADAMRPNTVAVLVETPTNPLMRITDLAAAADIAHRGSAILIADNTFASPYFQQPLALGADIVYHSTTKYINGHSDIIGGIAIVNDDTLADRLWFIANAAGAVPGPFDCWLALRGTKTLALRMEAHDSNGRVLAEWLANRLGHEAVIYPGLNTHPQHALAAQQMSGFGGMLSIEFGSKAIAGKMLESLRVFSLAESLGGVESLANHPATMTHASVPADRRADLGITDGLVRLSIGVEDSQDLLEDLDQALTAAGR
jgi:cystathionine beta-lyase/cystathionine gamma-synthase